MPSEHSSHLKSLAKQLRKPLGESAPAISDNMDRSNEILFDLTLETMNLKEGQKILEIGFGGGSFISKLFDRTKNLKVDGLDFSADMVRLATEKNQDLIKKGQLSLVQGSSDHLPFDDGSFDKVFCNMVIFFWEQPSDHLKEIKRVLKSDGVFYTGFRTKKSMMQLPFTRFGFHLYEPNEWQKVLEENGFKVEQTKRLLDPPLKAGPPIRPEGSPEIRLDSVCMAAVKYN